jgi:hypothetical protein
MVAGFLNGSPNHTLPRPFFEVEFPISLYRVIKGAWKIGDPDPNRVTILPTSKSDFVPTEVE